MRALSKKKGGQILVKVQKKSDPQQILHQIQSRSIAQQVGISIQQFGQFGWFFSQLQKFQLPAQIQRRLSPSKTLLYYNTKTNQQSSIHPSLELIKIFFYQSHMSNRAAFTFQNKRNKLLPFVEEKMMRNCISLNSKRRDVEKLNLQKDQNGKNVSSKVARLKPNIKGLISARSYMLKMLVEKVYTKKQIWGKGKRAKAYVAILNEKQKQVQQKQQQICIPSQDLQTYQKILSQTLTFYMQQYGSGLEEIPQQVLCSMQYKQSTPQTICNNLDMLNINLNQIQLYWFGRLMDCLDVPSNWSKVKNHQYQTYVYQPLKIVFDFHPSYVYIVNQINSFRRRFQLIDQNAKQMTFYDYFQRIYTVDIYSLMLKSELKKKSMHLENNKQHHQPQLQQQANDWMIVQAVVNSKLQNQKLPLVDDICQFWKAKNYLQQQFNPSISPFGQVTWSNTVNYSTIDYFPYKQTLLKTLQNKKQYIPSIQRNNFKYHLRESISISENKIQIQDQSEANNEFYKIQQERQQFLRHYLSNTNKKQIQPYNIKCQYSIENYFDKIFTSPFGLDQGIQFMTFQQKKSKKNHIKSQQSQIQGNQPFWLQKLRAKKFSERIQKMISSQFNIQKIKQHILEYTISKAKKQQPHKIYQYEQKIKNMYEIKKIEQFLAEITNVDLREERKRKINQVIQQPNDQDDIFGSDNDNVQPSLIQNQSQEQKEYQLNSQKFQMFEQIQGNQQIQESEKDQKNIEQVDSNEIQQIVNKQIKSLQKQTIQKDIKYERKTYLTNQKLDKLNNKQLNILIQNLIKKHIKKYKYGQTCKKQSYKYLYQYYKKLITLKNGQNLKRNLIITYLKYQTVPYKDINIVRFLSCRSNLNKKQKQYKCKTINQDFSFDQQQDFSEYQSQIDFIDTEEIDQEIQIIRKAKSIKLINQVVLLNPEKVEQSEPTVEAYLSLDPIKRTKPDILIDPRLRHISKLDSSNQLSQFRSTFSKNPCQNIIRSKSVNKLLKTPSKQEKQPINRRSQNSNLSLNKFSKIKLLTDQGFMTKAMTNISMKTNCFNRVCLANTATSLLTSQPLKRTSELVVLEARKTLLNQARGLQTYLSKKY